MTDNNALAQPFQREERYIVIKRKHLTERQEDEVRRLLAAEEIGIVECAVVENDWPEYETVWRMIEARVTGRTPAPAGEVGELVTELQEEAARLSGRSIERGCVDCGLAANIALKAADMLERLAGPVQQAGKPKYPDDGGLREQVRPLGESFNGFQMIREHFGLGEPVQQAGGDQVERAVMVCPQCEGEGSYADGLDEAACTTECTRCGGNGWIVDVAALAAMQPAPLDGEG